MVWVPDHLLRKEGGKNEKYSEKSIIMSAHHRIILFHASPDGLCRRVRRYGLDQDIIGGHLPDDTVAVTMTKDNVTYVLPTVGKGSLSQPLGDTGVVSGTTLTTPGASSDYGWSIASAEGGYTLQTGGGYLYIDISENKNNCVGSAIRPLSGPWLTAVPVRPGQQRHHPLSGGLYRRSRLAGL